MFAGQFLERGLVLPCILNLKEHQLSERDQKEYRNQSVNRENGLCYIYIQVLISFVVALTKFEDALIETDRDQEDVIDQKANNEGEVIGEVATTNASVEPVTMVIVTIDAFLADEAMARPWCYFNLALRTELIEFDLIDQDL